MKKIIYNIGIFEHEKSTKNNKKEKLTIENAAKLVLVSTSNLSTNLTQNDPKMVPVLTSFWQVSTPKQAVRVRGGGRPS